MVCAPQSAVVCDTCDTARARRSLANRAPRGRQHGDQPTHQPLGIFEVNAGSVRQVHIILPSFSSLTLTQASSEPKPVLSAASSRNSEGQPVCLVCPHCRDGCVFQAPETRRYGSSRAPTGLSSEMPCSWRKIRRESPRFGPNAP